MDIIYKVLGFIIFWVVALGAFAILFAFAISEIRKTHLFKKTREWFNLYIFRVTIETINLRIAYRDYGKHFGERLIAKYRLRNIKKARAKSLIFKH